MVNTKYPLIRVYPLFNLPCKIYPTFFRVAKAPEIFRAWHPFFSDLPYETQLFLRLPPQKISGAFATLKK